MNKHILLLVLVFIYLISCPMDARNRRREVPLVTYGLEWSYISTFNNTYHRNYLSGDGYREDIFKVSWAYKTNAQVLANVGVNAGRKLNVSLYGGYSGVYEVKLFPLSLRCTYYITGDIAYPHWFAYLDGGYGFCTNESVRAKIGKLGCGYRIPLSRSVKLDFLLSYQGVWAHIPFTDNGVEISDIRRNECFISSINLGIAITL